MDYCDLCNCLLTEGERDIHRLSKPYEIPEKIEWDGTKCNIKNRVVNKICKNCLGRIIDTVNSCIWGD